MSTPTMPPIPPMLAALFDQLHMRAHLTFPTPARLMNMNQRLHYKVRRRLTKRWRDAAAFAGLAQLGTTPTHRACDPCFVAVCLPVPDLRRRDPSNYAPTLKAIVDGLVDAGAWPDDTPEWVTTLEPVLYPCSITAFNPGTVHVFLLDRQEAPR